MLEHADYSAPTRQHELGHARSETDLPCLADLDQEVGIDHTDHTDHTDHVSEVCNDVADVDALMMPS